MICINTRPLKNDTSLYYKIKLKSYLYKACQYINVEIPKLRFIKDHENSHYPYWDKAIEIGSKDIFNQHKKLIEPYVNFKFNDYFSALLYTMFHELGHHVQFVKYPNSTTQYWRDFLHKWKNGVFNEKTYREHCFEKRPDKIACYLTKKYYPEGLTFS